ncbi:MAG: hypothetical protein WBP03_02955 [Candidatus Saccharimonadales bacterium]|jgi:hypothetical protein
MGSLIEINDTLRITKNQGFPAELDIETHLQKPYTLADVEGRVFEFKAKEKIRLYQQPPVRNFLVEDLNGEWLYWGLCYVLEVHHDYVTGVTSGKYKIVRLNTPREMRQHFELTHFTNPEHNYFTAKTL